MILSPDSPRDGVVSALTMLMYRFSIGRCLQRWTASGSGTWSEKLRKCWRVARRCRRSGGSTRRAWRTWAFPKKNSSDSSRSCLPRLVKNSCRWDWEQDAVPTSFWISSDFNEESRNILCAWPTARGACSNNVFIEDNSGKEGPCLPSNVRGQICSFCHRL